MFSVILNTMFKSAIKLSYFLRMLIYFIIFIYLNCNYCLMMFIFLFSDEIIVKTYTLLLNEKKQ